MATVTVAGAADEKRDAATVALDGCALGGNVRRKSLLCCGKPRDFTGDVVIVTNPNFDINTTIFKTAQGMLPRAVLKTKLGVHMYATASHAPIFMGEGSCCRKCCFGC